MRFLALTVLLAAPCALAKSKAKVNTSSNPTHHLARSPAGAVAARQGTSSSSGGEFCGTDDSGDDWYCEDSDTFCCTGPEVWQCAPITAEECCSTGYYCETGEHCYLDTDNEQLCLTDEEADDLAGDEPDDDLNSGGSSGSGSGSGSSSGSGSTSTDDDEPEETTGSSSTEDDEEDDDSSSSGGAAGSSGGRRKKGGSGGSSGAGKVGAGQVMAGVVALGALALI